MKSRLVISEGSKRLWIVFAIPWLAAISYVVISSNPWWEFYRREYASWREHDVVARRGISYDSFLAEKHAECTEWNARVYSCLGKGGFFSEKDNSHRSSEECEAVLKAVNEDMLAVENKRSGILLYTKPSDPGTRDCNANAYYGSPPRWAGFVWPSLYSFLVISKIIGAFAASLVISILTVHGAIIPLIKWVVAGFKNPM